MELMLKDNKSVELAERVYIGKGERDKVNYVSRILKYEELTSTAKTELPYIIKEVVKRNEKQFIKFINECDFIILKVYVKFLPGIGIRKLRKILEERELKPFESFEDFEKRVSKNLFDAIVKRIEEEIKEPQKYYLFIDWKGGIVSKNDIKVGVPQPLIIKYRWRKF